MKYNIYESGGAVESGTSIAGMDATNFVRLIRSPVLPNEAASKRYVDNLTSDLIGDNVKSGTLDKERLSGFFGDVIANPGSNILTLNYTGVAPNTYTTAYVTEKGRVGSGGFLSESDIPPLRFSKITSGKPITLEGYGITDALNRTSPDANGDLTLSNDPIDKTDVASKQYVDGKITTSKEFSAGDLLFLNSTVLPTGFLRCNGGEVSKTTYAELYSIIGDKYATSVAPNTGQPWRHQYAFNLSNSTITAWSVEAPTVYPFTLTQVVATKNRVYVLGSYIPANYQTNQIWSAVIDEDGNIGEFVQAGVMPYAGYWYYAVIIKNWLYCFGGAINGTNGVYNVVQKAPVNADGTLGAWSIHDVNLPLNVYGHKMLITTNKLYLITALYTYYCTIDNNGNIGAWTQGTTLPGQVFMHDAFVTKNRVYTVGGINEYGTTLTTINTATFGSDGIIGNWTTLTNGLGDSMLGTATITTRDRVFTLGGSSRYYSPTNVIRTAPINADGTLGAWGSFGILPYAASYISPVITSSKLYLFGMFDGYYGSTTVWSCSFGGGVNNYRPYQDGTIVSVSNPNNFKLPDYSTSITPSSSIFVKY